MKSLLLGTLFISFILLFSCKKDDEGGISSSNQLTFQGETYPLNIAYVEYLFENSNGSFDVDITITSKELDLSKDELSNIDLVYLDLNTSMENVLETGTYTFADERDAFVLVNGLVAIDATLTPFEGVESDIGFEVTGGTVTVAKSNETYTITFSISGEDGLSASGVYTGSLSEFN